MAERCEQVRITGKRKVCRKCDFEDCLQDECAQKAGAAYLVTCNKKDFVNAKTHAVTPLEMLEIVSSKLLIYLAQR